MQVCTSLQTDNHANTPPLKVFYRPDALPAAQPTADNDNKYEISAEKYGSIYWTQTLFIY